VVSSEHSTYRAEMVRLIHADPDLRGPGFKEERTTSKVTGEYAGRHQDYPADAIGLARPAQPLRHGLSRVSIGRRSIQRRVDVLVRLPFLQQVQQRFQDNGECTKTILDSGAGSGASMTKQSPPAMTRQWIPKNLRIGSLSVKLERSGKAYDHHSLMSFSAPWCGRLERRFMSNNFAEYIYNPNLFFAIRVADFKIVPLWTSSEIHPRLSRTKTG
jgi:hypothetical protein